MLARSWLGAKAARVRCGNAESLTGNLSSKDMTNAIPVKTRPKNTDTTNNETGGVRDSQKCADPFKARPGEHSAIIQSRLCNRTKIKMR